MNESVLHIEMLVAQKAINKYFLFKWRTKNDKQRKNPKDDRRRTGAFFS